MYDNGMYTLHTMVCMKNMKINNAICGKSIVHQFQYCFQFFIDVKKIVSLYVQTNIWFS